MKTSTFTATKKQPSLRMAAGGWTRKMKDLKMTSGSSFTLVVAILLIAALSFQISIAAATTTTTTTTRSSSSTLSTTSASNTLNRGKTSESAMTTTLRSSEESMISMEAWWNPIGDAFFKLLNKLRKEILEKLLKVVGLPPSMDILNYLFKVARFIWEALEWVITDAHKLIDTVMDWIVDSVFSPFKSIKQGIRSFQVIFRFMHKLRKGEKGGFSKENPIYRCYLEQHPPCVARAGGDIKSKIVYQFYCAWRFYEVCRINFWWEKGEWKAPNVNFRPCLKTKKRKC